MKNINVNEYTIADCGKFGKALERCLTGKAYAKSVGKIDWYHSKKRYEIKTAAGEIKNLRCDYVVYVPVPLANVDGTIDITKQEGFILTKAEFFNALSEAGAIRNKTTTAGTPTISIQTFWVRKTMRPHGKLYDRILDAMYDHCEMTLEEFLEG